MSCQHIFIHNIPPGYQCPPEIVQFLNKPSFEQTKFQTTQPLDEPQQCHTAKGGSYSP